MPHNDKLSCWVAWISPVYRCDLVDISTTWKRVWKIITIEPPYNSEKTPTKSTRGKTHKLAPKNKGVNINLFIPFFKCDTKSTVFLIKIFCLLELSCFLNLGIFRVKITNNYKKLFISQIYKYILYDNGLAHGQ